MKTTEFKLTLITEHAKRDKSTRFTSIAHLLNVEYLKTGFNSLNRNKAKGVDDVSWYDYNEHLDENLEKLVERLKKKSYRPIPAKRVYISKSDGKKRPLGISAIESKVVELGIKKILSSIYEEDFSNQSFGFRPKKSLLRPSKSPSLKICYLTQSASPTAYALLQNDSRFNASFFINFSSRVNLCHFLNYSTVGILRTCNSRC